MATDEHISRSIAASGVYRGAPSAPHWPHARRVGDVVLTSALAGADANGVVVAHDTPTQTHQALENVRLVIEAAGLDFSSIVKLRIFVREPADYEQLQVARNPYYEARFPEGDFPASTALVVGDMLPEGSNVAIEAVASDGKRTFDAPEIVKLIPLDLDAQPHWRLGGEGGELLWTTGQPGLDIEARLVGPDAATQTARCLENAGWILRAGGYEWTDVAKLNLYLGRASDHDAAAAVVDRFLGQRFTAGSYPACSALEARMAPPGMIAEVEVVAGHGQRREASRSGEHPASASTVIASSGRWAFTALLQGRGNGSRAQAEDVFKELRQVLDEIGGTDLLHVTIWLADVADINAVDEVCATMLEPLPAATVMRAAFPDPGTRIAVEGIAWVR